MRLLDNKSFAPAMRGKNNSKLEISKEREVSEKKASE